MSVPEKEPMSRSGGGGLRRWLARRRWIFGGTVAALLALVLSVAAAGGPIGTAALFEDEDGNLAIDNAGQMDWNGFAPTAWTGTAPYRQSTTVVNGWTFKGLEDALQTSSDTGFKGGTKQDDNCAQVIGSRAPNKDDLKRIYIAHKTVNGHIYLMLAWERIPQNSTSASAHVGFEFNQSRTSCGPKSDSLVERTAGDMLIVYDFEGGGAPPVLTVRRWVTSPGSVCEVSNDSPPCWGVAVNLSASGFAEAKVNQSDVSDQIAPDGTDTLHTQEFGEAGIDLTAAGIFKSGCTAFGQAEGVSRSSGNSANAAMEDLVGPGHVEIENCRPTTTTTGQKVVISDFAKPTGFGTPTGTVDFQLFTNSTCTGTPLYNSGPVTLVNGLASTDGAATQPPTLSANGTYYWLVSYSGDANNLPSTSPCGTEQTTISGNTPGVDP
jgi:hypothetical protein